MNGIVYLDDQPLSGATVSFFATEKGGTGGFARTGTDGKFVVTGGEGQSGLAAGSYKVTVSKIQGGVTDEEVIEAPSDVELTTRSDLPAIYSDPGRTELMYSVTGDGQPIEIRLDSKKRN